MEDDGEESEEDNHSRPPSRSWLRRLAARLFGAGEGGEGEPWRRRVRLKRLAGLLLFAYALARMLRARRPPAVPLERALYSEFLERVAAGQVRRALLAADTIFFWTVDAPATAAKVTERLAGHEGLIGLLSSAGVSFGAAPRPLARRIGPLLIMLVPFIYLGMAGYMLLKVGKGPGGGKNVGKRVDKRPARKPVLFGDAAGQDGAKAELLDIVRFLQRPEVYHRVGAVMPKGALLAGPSGTGKTLLARAVAGECGLPFFSCSASDFVEVYVGLGASRVRQLFAAARKAKPAIVFIDEIDALGGARSGSFGGLGGCAPPRARGQTVGNDRVVGVGAAAGGRGRMTSASRR